MPNCFTLTRIGSTVPSALSQVDEALCRHLGVAVHPTKYVAHWYSIIGFALACGAELNQEMVNQYRDDPELHRIAEYLLENYTSDAWAER